MINAIQTWGEEQHQSSALAALAYLGHLPGLYICQDPGCFVQVMPEEKDGETILTWEFGIFGQRVLASGHFEGCLLAYRLQSNGPRGGYSETVWADESVLYPTFAVAAEAMKSRQSDDAAALQKWIERCGEEWIDTAENRKYAVFRTAKNQQLSITPTIVLK